jgi:hypothetical protein
LVDRLTVIFAIVVLSPGHYGAIAVRAHELTAMFMPSQTLNRLEALTNGCRIVPHWEAVLKVPQSYQTKLVANQKLQEERGGGVRRERGGRGIGRGEERRIRRERERGG